MESTPNSHRPRVLNKRTLPNGQIPEGAVYVGRPSIWGNPFPLIVEAQRAQVLERYRVWLKAHPELIDFARKELKGKDLVCWCAPKACHADVLLEVANQDIETRGSIR